MKKTDWFIALFFMTLGLMCLMFSASYYQMSSFISEVGIFRSACIGLAAVGAAIYIIYRLIRFKQGKGK
ncbi:hypothetical protein M4D81_29085 [Paenibacillus sp. p3-SID867]|uniref:hypothetical protein n=1 Tax=Paenibacillus sp. p3-SID867 TaxID=2916363 RepID=UPI0021A41F9F|nr:hypothetical protein [Paenibacillus sp. p3-SID867]MCT1403055.1 hypothetical protein [Paenibacillus sp. p3-SID867]